MNYSPESQQIADLTCSARRILAISHSNPDADAIASLLAFRHVFGSDVREVTMALGSGSVPETLSFLPHREELNLLDTIDTAGFDLLVLLDCADEDRVGEIGARVVVRVAGVVPVVNIDHHVTNARFGSVNLVDPEAAATCEILALLFRDLNVEFDKQLATILFSGIQGDTLGLRTPSTTGRTLEVSADLIRSGADLDTIVDHLFRIRPFSTLKLWGLALSRATFTGDLVWSEVTPEMLVTAGADESEGEGIVNFLAGTKGARAAALLYSTPDGWRVSMRSLAEDVDVASLAARYGGGGHSRAAGCSLGPGIEIRDSFLREIADAIAVPSLSTPPIS